MNIYYLDCRHAVGKGLYGLVECYYAIYYRARSCVMLRLLRSLRRCAASDDVTVCHVRVR